MLFTLIVFILVLSVLVFVHEFGHFWSAKKLGVKVEEFGFGFPPRLVGVYRVERGPWWKFWRQRGHWKTVWGDKPVPEAEGTVYSLNWLPLGGFCKIKGDNGEGQKDKDSFINKPVWKRLIIISAGVIMNVVLAAVLFSIGFMIGLPQSVENAEKNAVVTEQKVQIIQIVKNSPAEKAGLKINDVVLAVAGVEFKNEAELRAFVNQRAGQELDYKIGRNSEILNLKITPQDNNGKGEIGIAIINTGLVKYPWHIAIWKGIITAVSLLWFIIVAFYELFKNLFLGHGVSADVAGPVGIAKMTGQYARMGIAYLLQLTAVLSVNLAVINFLPIPALDGGRIIFLLIEKLKGSPVKREVEAWIHSIGFWLLIILIMVITVKEIIGSGFFEAFKIFFGRVF